MRWLFRIIASVAVALLVAGGAILFLPGDKIASIAADQIRTNTGRDLVFTGDVSVTLWPVLGVQTGPVTFGNAQWAGPDPMLTAQSLAIGISAPDLLRGAIRVHKVVAVEPVLRLSTRADGRGNWEFGDTMAEPSGSPPTAATGAKSAPVTLEQLDLTGARLIYTAAGAEPTVLEGVNLALAWPSVSEPADIVLTARPMGEPVTIAANIGGFDGFIRGDIAPISARVTAPGGEFDFVGRAGLDGDASGRVTLNTTNTSAMLAALGIDVGAIPRGLGKVAKIDGDATYTSDGRLSVRGLSMTLDSNKLTGDVDVELTDPPTVTAQFNGQALDFSSVTQSGSTQSGDPGAGADSGWSTSKIDASALASLNGTISLNAQSLNLGVAQFGLTQLALQIDRARAVLKLLQVSAFDGLVTGQVVANNRNGLSVGGDLRVAQIDMKDALSKLADFDRLSGRADAQLKFLGSGASEDAIMRSLSGQGAIKMGRGVISGFDLDRLLRSGDGTGGTTVFDSLSATYEIVDGNLTNEDLLLLVAKIRATGIGRVGLGDRDIDYLLTPTLSQGTDPSALSVPIRIRGPWSGPSIRPDFSEALQGESAIRVEQVEQQARDAVQSKLEEELNVTVEDGQDAKEVLRDAIEDKAKNKFLQLLGQSPKSE